MLVATHDQTLHVLSNTEIKWAAHMECVPIGLKVAQFGGTAGMVVALDDTGKIGCFFLGTDPSMPEITTEGSRDLDYAAMDAEMQSLQAVIRDSVLGESSGSGGNPVAGIVIVKSDAPVLVKRGGRGAEKLTCTVQVHIKYNGTPVIENVSVAVDVQKPAVAEKRCFVISRLGGAHSNETIELSFSVEDNGHTPCDVNAVVSVSCLVASEPRSVLHEIQLPTSLFLIPAPPTKSAQFKVMLATTCALVNFTLLFKDMAAGNQSNITGTLAGFQLCSGDTVSIQAGKSKPRYRIVSDSFDGIWMVAKLLGERLQSHYESTDDFQLHFEDQLPLSEYFRLIDDHFEQRVQIAALRKELDARAHQLRVVQKRLLIRFKDTTPQPLQHLDTLLGATYDDVLFFAERIKDAGLHLDGLASELIAGTQLMLMLMSFKFGLDDADMVILRSSFYPRHRQQQSHGWQEAVEASLRFLLKTSLSKEPKDHPAIGTELALTPDTSKLKKYISQVCEKLMKGGRLSRSQEN
jgi:Bardet-Biedl syndrome 9 protein